MSIIPRNRRRVFIAILGKSLIRDQGAWFLERKLGPTFRPRAGPSCKVLRLGGVGGVSDIPL